MQTDMDGMLIDTVRGKKLNAAYAYDQDTQNGVNII